MASRTEAPSRGQGPAKKATTRMDLKGWEEKPYDVAAGEKKLTHSSVTESYSGDIEGTGKGAYLMMYRDDGSASFVGLHRIIGRVDGRTGSLVMQEIGTYEKDKEARGSLSVVPGSGTGELKGIRGEGESVSKHGEHHATITVTISFE
jgi:hypothetical protein